MRFAKVLMVLAGLAVSPVLAQEPPVSNPYIPTAQIRTTATATRSVPPDLAVAHFELWGRGGHPERGSTAASVTGEAVRRALVKAGVPADSVFGRGQIAYPWDQSTQMEIKQNPEFRRYDTTYVFRDMVVARIRELSRVTAVLDAGLAAGAQKLSSLQFSSSRVQQAGQEALSEATRQARRNAELMAAAAGGKVGRPLELTTDKSSSGDAFYDLRSSNINTGASSISYGLTAKPPNAELRVSVYGRWELLPAVDSIPLR
jgi:uncharacterized protein YggE